LPKKRVPRLEEAREERVGMRPGGRQHELLQSLRVFHGDDLADRAAGGMAEEVRLLDAERIHETQHVLRHLAHRVAHDRPVALSAAAVVVHDHAIAPGQLRNLLVEARADAAQPGNQEQRLARAVGFVVQHAVADRDPWHAPILLASPAEQNPSRAAGARS
jgi:hypothetical protein